MRAPAGRRPGSARDLDRHFLDGYRQRRLGLGRSHQHAGGPEAVDQRVGDRGAEPLQRAVGALGRDEGDRVADGAVVDRVLEPVGDRGVAVLEVEADVEDQPLAGLPLGLGDAVMGEDREAGDLDRDVRVAGLAWTRPPAPRTLALRTRS